MKPQECMKFLLKFHYLVIKSRKKPEGPCLEKPSGRSFFLFAYISFIPVLACSQIQLSINRFYLFFLLSNRVNAKSLMAFAACSYVISVVLIHKS